MTVPVANMTATFSNASITYDAIGMNVTDTASNANSTLINLKVGGTSRFNVKKTGEVTANVVNANTLNANTLNANTLYVTNATPASATATGVKGQIVWDTNYIYVCVATNTWKRAAISTWI